MAYCEVVDLLIGDIPTSTELSPQKYVNDAADEIDSKIGFRYGTPIPVTAGSTTPRPVVLLLKRINAHLATGRLILAATISGEMQKLNAYGQDLVDNASLAILAIASGEQPLAGVPAPIDIPGLTDPHEYILQYNEDPESNVDAFYNRIAMPGQFVTAYPVGHPSYIPAGG